jgi:hypothetical protein
MENTISAQIQDATTAATGGITVNPSQQLEPWAMLETAVALATDLERIV